MLSRVASSIYWMSRYLERADNVARFIDVNTRLILDMGWEREEAQWDPLIKTSGDAKEFKKRYKTYDEESVVRFLTVDGKNPNSILSCVQQARENARTVRETISSEMWETINVLFHLVQEHGQQKKLDNPQEFCKHVHQASHLFTGLTLSTMSHGEGWHFARIGSLLERADKTTRLLDVKFFYLLPKGESPDSPYDSVEWGSVLRSVSGFEMYRKEFHSANYRDVTQFLILDKEFPRAIRCCVDTAQHSLNYITEMLKVEVPATREMDRLCQSLAETDADTILREDLHKFIDVLQRNLNQVDESLFRSFFALERN